MGFRQDRLNARLMGVKPTGNGRRQSYAHATMTRMTNTYMLAGDKHPDEILKSIRKGLFAKSFGGGQVDITSGKFVFSCTEAYLIEDGKITTPVRGATIIGSGADALTRISMVGNDMELDPGIGTGGKQGKGGPVGGGQPPLRFDRRTVGGRGDDGVGAGHTPGGDVGGWGDARRPRRSARGHRGRGVRCRSLWCPRCGVRVLLGRSGCSLRGEGRGVLV